MKRNTTKSALVLSVLSLLVCFTMLLGTTFAWFTDSVSSANNTIVAGNLDVELYHSNDKVTDAKVTDTTELFELENNGVWEPGVTVYENLTVANEGSLALKYKLKVNAANATATASGKTLADVLKVAVVKDGFDGTRADAQALDGYTALASFELEGLLEAGKDITYGIVIWWEPTANDNDFNMNNGATETLKVDLGVALFATQVASEYDSFGNTYDSDATFPGTENLAVKGGTAATPAALEDILSGQKSVFVKVEDYASWTTGGGHGSTPFGSGEITIAGNGADKSTFVALGSGVGPIAASGKGEAGKLVMKNVTVVDNSVSYAEDSWEFTYLEFGNGEGSELYFENVVFTSGIQTSGKATFVNCTFISEADSEYAVWVENGSASFTGCVFEGTRGLKMHEAYGSEISSVTVDKCEFNELSKKPGIAIGTLNADTAVSITNSIFTNCQAGDQGLYSYETDTDVNTISFTYEYNTVVNEKKVTVADETELKDALTGAGMQGAGSTVVSLPKDATLDFTGTAWTPVKVDGYHGADIVTIDGNGATIKGLTAPLFAGGFAGGSGIVIKNLTIADSNIVSTNDTGSGAFIESVDSMEIIKLENCHLVNSTVNGVDRTGGLVGWTSGYNNVNDGAVKTEVIINNCSVVDCKIISGGSAAAINGHAGANAWTFTTITNCVVKNNEISSTNTGSWRVGEVVGTANVGEVTISNVSCSGNTLSQTGKTVPAGQTSVGRIALGSTGKLTIDGVAY